MSVVNEIQIFQSIPLPSCDSTVENGLEALQLCGKDVQR